jgi:Uma2 family endonuclease
MSLKTLLTADDLERMPADDTARTELDEGELIRMPPAGWEHNDIAAELTMILRDHAKKNDLGKVLATDAGFRLGDETVRAPDVAFVKKDRVAAMKTKGFAEGAPDLVVEIFSPSDSVPQLMRKVKQYFQAGCHTVWVVYPGPREIHVLEASGADRLLRDTDMLEAPELLPGLSIRVAQLFE